MNEFSTLSWAHVKSWAEGEVEKLRVRNDSMDLDYDQTIALRGEIRALKRLLDLPRRVAQDAELASSATPTMTDL